MDEVVALIRQSLPTLSQESFERVEEKINDIGVCNVDDLKLIREQDLIDVLKPIQIRKLIQKCSAVKSLQTHEFPSYKDDSSENLSDKTDSLFGSPSTSRCTTPTLALSDTDSTPTQTPRSEDTPKVSSGPKSSNWVQNFTIPWHKFPKVLLEACKNKARPKPSDRRELVRILCDDIQQHCSVPGRKTLSKIAEMVVEKYPESFCDAVGDTILATGFESLRKQIEERLYNQNRKVTKSGSLNRKLIDLDDDDDDTEPKTKGGKKPICDSYGCVNWQPDSFPENENNESQKEKQEWLTAEFCKKNKDKENIALFMKETYASQRLFINRIKPNSPSINEIKKDWPFLFETDSMLEHFEELMGFNLQVVLKQSLEEKASVVYNYMKKEHLNKRKVKESLLKIDEAMEAENSKLPQMPGAFLLLLAYFGEPKHLMIRCFDEMATVGDVMSDVDIPTTPFIAIFGDILGAKRCGLVVDKVMVNSEINGFAEGVIMWFASYFVLNIQYPVELAATLEFIQRCFVNLNPNKGTKKAKTNKGKHHAVNPKVLSLANGLKDFQSQWAL